MGKKIAFKDSALSMEKTMALFYQRIGDRLQTPRLKEMIHFLLSEEEKHVKRIEELASVEIDTDVLDEAFYLAGDIMKCFVLTSEHVQSCLSELQTETDVIKLAIQCEKDMILFYQTLRNHMENEDLLDQIEIILEGEYEHLRQLFQLFNILHMEKQAVPITRL
jgi:rubrerythrin